ncbi:MAG: 1-deoxy-D-xylulose-5-phosphate reductoisomerase [Pseudothermotoga sp.]
MEKTTVVILGITGSIGVQAVEVINRIGGYEILAGTYRSNEKMANQLSSNFNIRRLLKMQDNYEEIFEELEKLKPQMTIVAVPGFVSLPLTLKAIDLSSRVLLASKEALVCGGWLVRKALAERSTQLLPIDSEHSALMQLYEESVQKVLLTSSGGALRDWKLEMLEKAKPEDVLKHPVWQMGKRITVDSATMVNKGFEVLEAYELFGIEVSKIQVLIHKEGIVHAAVFLKDGTVKMHLGFADMRVPIAYALTYPGREYAKLEWPDLSKIGLSFYEVDQKRYPAFHIAYEIWKNYAKRTAYNAADEIAVEWFLKEKISFTDIPKVIERVVDRIDGQARDLKDLIDIDECARKMTLEVIECL